MTINKLFENIIREAEHEPEDTEALDSMGQQFIIQNMNDICNELNEMAAKLGKKRVNRLLSLVNSAYRNGNQTKDKKVFEECLQIIKSAAG